MKAIILGTGNAMATRCYNTCFALENEGRYLLVDTGGGNGILTRLRQAGICPQRLDHLFVTHAHMDHILGVIWIVRDIATRMTAGNYAGTLTIWCHDELPAVIDTYCRMFLPPGLLPLLGSRIVTRVVGDGEQVRINGMDITFFDIRSTKLRQFGLAVRLPGGGSLCFLGDEPYHPGLRPYVEGAEWLFCEAFCLEADEAVYHPYEKHHSTARHAARTAQELGVRNLLLLHTEDDRLAEREALYTQEAKKEFAGNVFVPDDLEVINL